MQKYIVGIDTGGTYTDGVLLDRDSQKIIATAKKPTTHYQLSVAIGDVLRDLLLATRIDPADISKVAVSSTLATNAVVENKGARVAVIVIGYVKHFKLPVKAVVYVKGGHNIQGAEEEPLDLDYLVELISGLQNEVDGYGICSAMSIKNPAHELVAEKAIGLIDPKPVFCSHKISTLAGMQERAATAGLHAKLMPIMTDFIEGVNQAVADENISCSPLVISGDGQSLDQNRATHEAALTVASGPACSAHFGAFNSENNLASLIIDVGGTTTDIAMIKNSQPLMNSEGCHIGLWRTHVPAVDMQTAGIGGDSLIHVDKRGKIEVGPSRVTPLATCSAIPSPNTWLDTGDNSKLIGLLPGSTKNSTAPEVTRLFEELGPVTVATIREKTGLGGVPLDRQLEEMTRNQIIYECGFTPTDALHVLGRIDLGNREISMQAAQIYGDALEMSAEDFSVMIVQKTEELIENLIIDYLVKHYWQNSLTSFIATRKDHPALGVEFSVKMDLIGIGAAARHFLPQVAAKLKTRVHFPDYNEVGNAVGAALIGAGATS